MQKKTHMRLLALLLAGVMICSQGTVVFAANTINDSATGLEQGQFIQYASNAVEGWNFEDSYTLAQGASVTINLDSHMQEYGISDYSVQYTVDDPSVASVVNGVVYAGAEGQTIVRAICTYSGYSSYGYGYSYDDYDYDYDYDDDDDYYGTGNYYPGPSGGTSSSTISFYQTIYVTNPQWEKASVGINIYGEEGYYDNEGSINVKGVTYDSRVSWENCKGLNISWYDGTLYFYPEKTGTYKVHFTIDGKEMPEFVVKVYKLYFARNKKTVGDEGTKEWDEYNSTVLLYVGETTDLKAKGFEKGKKVKWTSSNPSVVSVNSKGKLKGKSGGYATITASNDQGSISYKVAVSYKAAVKAVRYALAHYNSEYSQEQRMAKGKYDCSSYVWRSYKDGGTTLGSNGNWAPTAADLGKWCAQKKYVILNGKINQKKMLPGDLIFETGDNNGRYKGIFHVDLYIGDGKAITVQRTKYYWDGEYNVMVARPYKAKK